MSKKHTSDAGRDRHALVQFYKHCHDHYMLSMRFKAATGHDMPDDRLGWMELAAAYGFPTFGQGEFDEGTIYAWIMGRAQPAAPAVETVGEWLTPPMTLTNMANRLGNCDPRKVKSILRPYGLRTAGNRQLWTVRLDIMPPNQAKKLTAR